MKRSHGPGSSTHAGYYGSASSGGEEGKRSYCDPVPRSDEKTGSVAGVLLVDYRYGREASPRGLRSDNALPELAPAVLEEAGRVAKVVAGALRSVLPAPVLYSLDGVIDERGDVWWLEINSNPTMPPEGYDAMLSELFSA